MSEAAQAAARAEYDVLNARCAASPREAANYAVMLRLSPRAEKDRWLFDSALYNSATLVRLLLANGLSPSTTNTGQSNMVPLHAAAQGGAIDVVRLLLEAGADANSLSSLGSKPLCNATAASSLAHAS